MNEKRLLEGAWNSNIHTVDTIWRLEAKYDAFTKRLIALGRMVDKDMAAASVERCNCMIRCGTIQMPAVRKGKKFFTPEGDQITTPDSFEDMGRHAIKRRDYPLTPSKGCGPT